MMELKNYQNRIVDFLTAHDRAILSVDMGLGKTAAVLHWVAKAAPESLIIVAPKRVAETVWKQESDKWGLTSVSNKMVIVSGTAKKRQKALTDTGKPYKIISRDNLADLNKNGIVSVDTLILDELTSFKTIDSKRTKAVLAINARRRVGLTGTFLANGAIDVFAQAAAVGLDCYPANFYAWRAVHFRDVLQGSGLQFSKWKLMSTLDTLLAPIANNVFTLSAADYLEIPPVSETRHTVTLSDECRKAYDDMQSFLSFTIGGEEMTVKEKQVFCKLQQMCNGFIYSEDGAGVRLSIRSNWSSKVEDVTEFCERCKGESEQVLLFYAFREEAVWLYQTMTERGLRCASVNAKDFLDRWNNGGIDVLFAHPASAGHGLNLQHGGHIVVWSSLTYNYELWAQANARLARQGQTKPVQIHVFTADNTCEEEQRKVLARKDSEQQKFITMTKQ